MSADAVMCSAPWNRGQRQTPDTQDNLTRAQIPSYMKKPIKSKEAITKWQRSEVYQELISFIRAAAEPVMGKRLSDITATPGPALRELVKVLDEVLALVDTVPLHDMKQQRFGNKAFRDWFDLVMARAETDMHRILIAGGVQEDEAAERAKEVLVYWLDCFGNSTRIDYGTGHEMNFVVLLLCLHRLKCITNDEMPLLVSYAFTSYMKVVRRLQSRYCMEPAGSRGVWGLDDYHHLPFLWGAAQLIDNRDGLTSENAEKEALKWRDEYLYMDGVAWILENKKGPFGEHSPTLHSLGRLLWPKIYNGMVKMYCGEVLDKWPIVQHLFFGTILVWPEDDSSP